MQREPAAAFPARLAIARVQSSGYSNRTSTCYGSGKYCLITTRDVESAVDFERLTNLPGVKWTDPSSAKSR